ncbi:hypothetical protein 162322296 [Organic Lake phycodnavirus 1]|jgi:hypothetical protein|nr:hypothetical protein 162322296 [Organic Lake phycodnavirus 1]
MSSLSTFPNKFQSDDSTKDSVLKYNFSASVDMKPIQNDDITENLQGSKYLQVSVPNETSNVLFDTIEYSFQGLYITKQKDLIDDELTTQTHILLIECYNKNFNKYIFISIPLNESKEDTNINELFDKGDEMVSLNDLNHFISLEDSYYSYPTIGINDKDAVVILYTSSILKVKPMDDLTDTRSQEAQTLPLSISEEPALKVSKITPDYIDDKVFIDCQPVDETNQAMNVNIIKPTEIMNEYMKMVGTYLILFLIMLSIFLLIRKFKNS